MRAIPGTLVITLGISVATLLLTGAPGQASIVLGPPSAERATLIYDPTTGDMQIDPNGNKVRGFSLKSAAPFFVAEAALPPNASSVVNTDSLKWWCLPDMYWGAGFGTVWDYGNIAPSGLSQDAFLAALNNGNTYWLPATSPSASDYNLAFVPEPTSLLGMCVFGAIVMGRRRTRTGDKVAARV